MAGQVWVRSASAQQVILAQPSWHQRLRSVLSPALCLGGDLESVSLPSRRASVSECINFPLSLSSPCTRWYQAQTARTEAGLWEEMGPPGGTGGRKHLPPHPWVHRWRATRGAQFRGAERSTCCLSLSCVQLPVTPWTAAKSTGVVAVPSSRAPSGPGIQSLMSPALAGGFFNSSATWDSV